MGARPLATVRVATSHINMPSIRRDRPAFCGPLYFQEKSYMAHWGRMPYLALELLVEKTHDGKPVDSKR